MKLSHLICGALFAAPLFAAPPSVTTLTPGGGQRATTVTVTAAGAFERWPVEVWSSDAGVTARAEKEKGKFAIAVANDAPLGVVWFRFHDATGASQLRPFIVGGLPETAEAEPNDDARKAPAVSTPTVVNGVLDKNGDVDCYAVQMKKGQTLVASMEAHRTLRSPIDAVMEVLTADGTVVEQNHDARGLDPEIAYTVPAEGTYVVRVFAFPSEPNSSIRYFGSPACVYRLTVTADEFIDFARPLAVERGKEAELTLSGWNLKTTKLTLGAEADRVSVAHPFLIARDPHPCFDLTHENDKTLSPPFTATGHVAKQGTPASFTVNAEARKPLTVRLDSTSLGLSLTPILKVTDAAGKQLVRAEPAALGGAIETTVPPTKAGPLAFEVSDLFNSAGPRHLFRLRVIPATPDVVATVASDRFTVTVGTPLDIPITVARKNGFEGDLVPFAEGLPNGVSASVLMPEKPDPKTVVLRLQATKANPGGPVRIGIQKKGDEAFRRTATSLNSGFDVSTENMWLTAIVPAVKK